MFSQRSPYITDVFTPRNSDVNSEMYVDRPDLERELVRSLKRNSHSLLFGDSGNGKSWLYKKVLSDADIPFVVANCANASRLKSVTQEICNCLIEPGTVSKLGFSEQKAAEINAYFAKGGLTHSDNYEIAQEEPLLKAFRLFDGAKPGRKIVVLDNLESIFGSEYLMDELADIVILLDDDRYASCDVNLLIVGVPNGVLQYFSSTKSSESVSNRIQEIDKVVNLNEPQVEQIVSRGFSLLKVDFPDNEIIALSRHVMNVTLGIAQRVHEYCEYLAYKIEDNDWYYDSSLLEEADLAWLKSGLRQSYQVVRSYLNSRETSVSRRNQVVFCIAKVRQHQFDSNHIDSLIRDEFPTTVPASHMGIGSILTELSSGESPLLNKHSSNNLYSVRDPRYLMCIRLALYKDHAAEKVVKKGFTR
ncbi:ATP-binding protein [Halomonas urmiana]|uniref:ATP-binding protein n=1 Tax=Halomonas urmiana TaxID=490901 RepID=A0A5R8M8N5_9GAMM|nr:AAA family ATPase [Halomonas urmiana]TLF45931.1 ATP-binding protein [Halomonas urmiana]